MVQSPGGLIKFRQALAGVNEHGKDGDPSASLLIGSFQTLGYSISICKDSKC